MTQATYLQVWAMPMGASGIAWDVTSFLIVDRLIPQESFLTTKSAGSASFRLLRKLRDDGVGDGLLLDTFVPFRGQYVAIVPGGGQLDMSAARWVGCITDIPTVPLQGANDEIGTVTARELGWIFDQVPIRSLTAFDSMGVGQVMMDGIASANHQGTYQGQIIGNCYNSGSAAYFAAHPFDCGADFTTQPERFWTPRALIQRLLADARSDLAGLQVGNIPAIDLVTPDSMVSTYLDVPIKEVIPLQGNTLGTVIDLLFGAARSLNWRIFPSTTDPTRWQLIVRSSSDVTIGSLPSAPVVDVDLKGFDAALTLAQAGTDLYDQVEVWGSPIVCCGTVSFSTNTLAKGWTQAQEDLYNAGASASAGYGALTNPEKVAANNLVRSSGYLADVYQRFTMQGVTGGTDLGCSDSASGVQLLCPRLTWDGSSLTITGQSANPFLPAAKINRELPWPAGLPASGTDSRSSPQKATPSYLDPVVIHYDTNMPKTYGTYINLAHQPRGLSMPSPTISIDNRGLAVRITLAPAHMLSLGMAPWNGTGTTPAISDTQPSSTYSPTSGTVLGLNYTKLMATVAVDSGQCLVVKRVRSGVSIPRNVLRVQRPDMACWLVRGGTILGWTGVTALDKTAADTFTRNDYPAAQKLCDELAGWAFRKRQGATLSVAISTPFTVPAWAVPGVVIGVLNEYTRDQTSPVDKWKQAIDPDTKAAVVRTLNTPITSIRQTWGDSPRYEVTTSDPQAPTSTSLAAGVNGWNGGSGSVSLGGTPGQVMSRLDVTTREVARNIRGVIPVDLQASSPVTVPTVIQARGGNAIYTLTSPALTWPGILSTGSISSVPTLNPIPGTTYANGLGWGYIQNLDGSLGSTPVWICNATMTNVSGNSFTSPILYPIAEYVPISSVNNQKVTCAAGGQADVYLVSRIG